MEENVQAPDSIGAGITANPASGATKAQQLWLKRIKHEQKCHKDFRDRAKVVEEIFRKGEDDENLYVPLYWEVVNIEHAGVYSNQPVPDVRPRAEKFDPIMKKVSRILQRGLSYCTDDQTFDMTMHRCVDDYLAMGLGIPRVKVESIIHTEIEQIPRYEDVISGYGTMGEPIMQPMQVGVEEVEHERVGDQTIRWVFTPWSCFGYEPCNHWKDCEFIYIRHKMTQKQCIARFGRPIKASKEDEGENKRKLRDVYEIWCKTKKQVLFFAKGEDDIIETIDDPLELIGFYPCPEPMMMNLPSDKLVPQPDYDYIEHYDVEINRLQERRMGLMEQIRASGAYDSGLPELSEMMENEDGQYTPVANLMQRLNAAGGADNALYHLPITDKALVVQQLTEQIQFVRSSVDEVLGISDIVRGVTAASETATAQEIKGRWVGVRLSRKRECVQYTVKQMMRIMAQLLASHITPENLMRMTQMEITDQELQIMQDDTLLTFAVDIETDSTVAKDETREMTTKQEMLNGVAQYAQSVLPMVQQNQMPAGVASAILRSALNPYTKYDRNLEDELTTLPQTLGQLQQMGQQLQQLQQELQGAQQQSQQWQMIATQLQQQATEAKSQKEMADARKKTAEATEIEEGLESVADQKDQNVELTTAQTIESLARAKQAAEPKQIGQNNAGLQ